MVNIKKVDLALLFLDETFEIRKLARRILEPSVPSDSQFEFNVITWYFSLFAL